MSSSWWSQKLSGGQPPAPPPQTHNYPPQAYPPQTTYPAQPGTVYPATPSYVPQQPQSQPLQPGQRQELLDPRRAPTDQVPMGEAITLWKGGEARRKEGDWYCPECGSQHFYSRTKGSGIAGKPPAPRCFECGYTGLYTQADQANWAV